MSQEQYVIQVLHSALSISILRYRRKLYCIRNKCVLWPCSAGVCSQWVGSGRKHLWYYWQQVTAKSSSAGVSSSRQPPLSTERRGCTKGTQTALHHTFFSDCSSSHSHTNLCKCCMRDNESSFTLTASSQRARAALCAAQCCTVPAEQQQQSPTALEQSPFHTQWPNVCLLYVRHSQKQRQAGLFQVYFLVKIMFLPQWQLQHQIQLISILLWSIK